MNDEEIDNDDAMWQDDEEPLEFVSICETSSKLSHSSLEDALQHDFSRHHFDLLRLLGHVISTEIDESHFYSAIQCINKCRHEVLKQPAETITGPAVEKAYLDFIGSNEYKLKTEESQFFQPVLEDDAFLFHVDDLLSLARKKLSDDGGDQIMTAEDEQAVESSNPTTLPVEVDELASLKDQLHKARAFIVSLAQEESSDNQNAKNNVDNDSYYFESYSHYSIHETMLRDTVRTDAYRRAILDNAQQLFHNKVVLDVGCGTGILSLFAAQAGAKKVIAVDNAAYILKLAQRIAKRNQLDHKITFVKGKMETLVDNTLEYLKACEQDRLEIEHLPRLPLDQGETIDLIVSEWMGYSLFFETMLPSVMCARDHFLSPNGTMYPNATRLYMEGATDGNLRHSWNDVYGFDYQDMAHVMALELTKEASVELVPESQIVTQRFLLIEHDMNAALDSDLDFCVPFCLEPTKSDARIDKLVISFDVDFSVADNAVSFSTACQATPTHWKQTTLWLDPMVAPVLCMGEIMEGTLKLTRNPTNTRDLDFLVRWVVTTSDGNTRCDGSLASTMNA